MMRVDAAAARSRSWRGMQDATAAAVDRLIADNPLFAAVSAAHRARLLAEARVRRFAAGERVLDEGAPPDFLYALQAGAARVFHASPSGLEVVIKVFRPPAVFGEMEAIVGVPMLENVDCLEPSELLLVPRPLLLDLVAGDHRFAVGLLRDVCVRLCTASQHEKALAFHSVRERLANFLVACADHDGVAVDRGILLRGRLSQDTMAAALGVTRRSIATEIIRWKKAGVLTQRGASYVVVDRAALAAEASELDLRLDHTIR